MLKPFSVIILLGAIGVASYATTVTVTFTTLQSKNGVLHNVYYETVSGPGSTTPTTNTALIPSASSGSYSIAAGTNGFLWSPSFSTATTVPASRMMFDIWASAPANAALDGSASANSAGFATINITLATTNANDVLYLSVVEGNAFTVSTITSSPSLTWIQRISVLFSTNKHLETWYAIWSASGSIAITITLTGLTNAAAVAFGITGANTAAPFDSNAAIPRSASGTGTSASVTVSTTSARDFIIGASGVVGNPALTTGTGFTLILTQTVGGGTSARETSDEYQVVSAAQTNLAVGYSWSGSQDWAMIGDAVVSPAISFTLRTTDSAGTLVSTLLGSATMGSIPAAETQISASFSISSGSIPAGGFLEVIITAPSGVSITIFWGVGQPTNFQVPQVVET